MRGGVPLHEVLSVAPYGKTLTLANIYGALQPVSGAMEALAIEPFVLEDLELP